MATYTAASTSSADVQSKINLATDGDTVIVPSGSSTWTTQVTCTVGITLKGAGIGNTIITNTAAQGQGNVSLLVTLDATSPFHLVGFDFRGQNSLDIEGSLTTKPFWVDTCNFNDGTNNDVFNWFGGNCYGLVSSCTFTAGDGSEMNHNMGTGINTETSLNGWHDDFVPGSINQVYFEDCTFTKDPYIDDYFWGTAMLESYYGARTVVRNSTLYYCDIDQHGTAGNVGTRWYEFYNNTWHLPPYGSTSHTTPPNQSAYIVLRAGSGVVFNNTVIFDGLDNVGGGINIYEENSNQQEVIPGQADPELYQPGRGINENLSPIYYWNNIDGTGSAMSVGLNGSAQNPPDSYSNTNLTNGVDVIGVTNGVGITKSQASADGGSTSSVGATYTYKSLQYPHPFRIQPTLLPLSLSVS